MPRENTISNAQFVEILVAKIPDLTEEQALVMIETIGEDVLSALHQGGRMEVRGFGTLKTTKGIKPRARNPKTGVTLVNHPTIRASFKGSSTLTIIEKEKDYES